MNRRYVFLVFLLLIFSITACSGGQNRNFYVIDPTQAQYYQGVQGVVARFDQIPPQLYYYGDVPRSSANDFPVSVEVWNKGTSYTRGGIFLSGYDPNIIAFDEILITQGFPGACSVSLGQYSLNTLDYFMQCGDDFAMGGHEGNFLDMISVRGISWFENIEWLENVIIDYTEFAGGEWKVNLGLDDITFAAREHGMLLISILAGLSFERFLGTEYLLAGNTYEYPGGELDYLQFNGHLIDWPHGADQIQQHIMLTNCYMYTTFAAPTVCIDPQPYGTNRKVCTPRIATWSNGQGAPVAITRVTQENTPRTAVFHIEVRNAGMGTVYDAGKLEKCSPYYPGGAKSADMDTIWIGEVRIGNQQLTCSPQTHFRLNKAGVGQFTCTYPIQYAELNSAYQTGLVIELWYGYGEVFDMPVMVKRVT